MAFNSKEYAWSDVKVLLAGRPITGIRGIKYKMTRTVTDIYAAGNNPHTRTKGNKVRTGEITLLQSEVEALLDAAKQRFGANADLTDLDFDCTIAYAASPTSQITTDQLVDVTITEFEKGLMQDDPNMEIVLPIMIGNIKYGV